MRALTLVLSITAIPLLGACASVPPGTGSPADSAETVKLTGSRLDQPRQRMQRPSLTSSPMHIVHHDDAEFYHGSDTADVLRRLPFVTIR